MINERPSLFLYGAAADDLRQREIERIKAATIPTLAGLRALSLDELHSEMAGMLERLGYNHHATDAAGDLIVSKDGRKLVVACAQPPEPIRRQAIARLHEAITRTNAAAGFYVTTRDFEPDAISYAAGLPITLVNGDKLVASLRQSKAGIEPPEAYKAMCKICGAVVEHRLSHAEAVPCGSGHFVAPTIARAAIFPEGAKPPAAGEKPSPAPRQRHGRRMTAKAHNKRLRLAHARRAQCQDHE